MYEFVYTLLIGIAVLLFIAIFAVLVMLTFFGENVTPRKFLIRFFAVPATVLFCYVVGKSFLWLVM